MRNPEGVPSGLAQVADAELGATARPLVGRVSGANAFVPRIPVTTLQRALLISLTQAIEAPAALLCGIARRGAIPAHA